MCTFTPVQLPKKIPVAAYGQFVVANLQEISNHLVPTIFNNFLLVGTVGGGGGVSNFLHGMWV